MSFIDNYSLNVQTVRNGRVVPTDVNRTDKTFTGGVYSQNGDLVENGLRQHPLHTGPKAFPQLSLQSIMPNKLALKRVKKGRYLYLGFYTEHYGHFLLETLSRLWAAKETSYDGYIFNEFVIPRKTTGTSVLANACFSAFGIDLDKINIVTEDTYFEFLSVPNPQFYIGNKAHPSYSDTYQSILASHVTSLKAPHHRIYLSRSAFQKRKRKVLNEAQIEKAFIEHGFIVIHPQELSFTKQLEIFSQTKIMAGLEGSGLHNCVFMPEKGEVINLCGPRSPRKLKSNQVICNRLNGHQGSVLPFVGDVVNPEKQISRMNIPHVKTWLRKHFD
ncbi:glycosyltransferase family 61 protein [Shewanella japonica]|uniref:glycosyltransferase family 61 protein n=1 Tax=Shewanella japonica TaxID=93973 RepID=UPI0024958289|nr:glycosyltransferase family 61 protein [Shewanella japonica]